MTSKFFGVPKQNRADFKMISPQSRSRILVGIISILMLSLMSCWDRQELDVSGPEMPRYELFGEVRYVGDGLLVAGLDIQITQIEVYQGDALDPMFTTTDSAGAYSFPELFRGRYRLRISQENLIIHEQDVGLINFADREYNAEVPRAIQLIQQEIDFASGEEVRGLSHVDESPLALTYWDGQEVLRKSLTNTEITPTVRSHWQHSGLADRGNGEYASIRRQIDTTIVDGSIRIGSPQYYMTLFDATNETQSATSITLTGEHLTERYDYSGYWSLRKNFMGQKSLYQSDLQGNTQLSIPLAGNQAGVYSFVQNDTAFWTVDTAAATLWLGTLSDSLYGRLSYKVFDMADSMVTTSNYNPVKFLAPYGDTGMFIARRNGVWSAEIIGK